ncbi:RsiV family protein [Romboutsia sp.]|uniref:RsiV family protein n=1 Tax=Romboutsia sp. TaxID=1965302 RepID=UPI002BAA4A44|nr:RsiV family protein [Romboutsia sp.]HSQ87291.1 RsiV family protein [Romboutsia sp.]
MLSIYKKIMEENDSLVRCSLNYPVIKEQECEGNIIQIINQLIYEDIISFKDVVKHELGNKIFRLIDYVYHAITEYRITFNKNDIVSIPIEFSQLIGLYDITYVNSYNFDISLGKYINLSDIFDTSINYIDIINEKLSNKVSYMLNKYKHDCCEKVYEQEKFEGIYDNQTFYIEEDGIVICFSSYEMSKNISHLIEFKLLFSDYIDYLSKYTINNIWRYNDNVTY